MKQLKIISFLFFILFLSSCASQEESVVPNQKDGLMNVMIKIPGEDQEFQATVPGPYKDGETIYVKVPTLEEDPLDITRLKPTVSLQNNCFVEPALPNMVDFSEPYSITVRNAFGETKTNIIKVLPTPMKVTFKNLWFKSSIQLGINNINMSGMTVTKDNVLVNDGDFGIYAYDRYSMELIKTISNPTSFTMKVVSDDAGHLIVNRYNIYGAGFMLYFYETLDSSPNLILNYEAGDGVPDELGTKMSVTGNLKEGKAYVYATAPDNMNIYFWEFNDGVVKNEKPIVINYNNAGSPWAYAIAKRELVNDKSDLYVSYHHHIDENTGGSRFEVLQDGNEVPIQMDKNNHSYKILDFETFEINGDEFLVMLTQGFAAWDESFIKIFEITNKEMLELKPNDADYDEFLLFQASYGGTNYNKWGDIGVYVDNMDAYIYVSSASSDADKSGVLAYRMIYTPQ